MDTPTPATRQPPATLRIPAPSEAVSSYVFGRLPSSPVAVKRLVELAACPDVCGHDVAEVAATDPVLTLRLLRLGSPGCLKGSTGVGALWPCIEATGATTAALAALDFELPGGEDDDPAAWLFLDGLWRESATHARASRLLARTVMPAQAGLASVCALVSRIGQLIMLDVHGQPYLELLSGDTPRSWLERERAAHAHTHLDVSAWLLRSWSLPADLHDVVAGLEDPERLDQAACAVAPVAHLVRAAGRALDALRGRRREDAARELMLGSHPDWQPLTPHIDTLLDGMQHLLEDEDRCGETTWTSKSLKAIKGEARIVKALITRRLGRDLRSTTARSEQLEHDVVELQGAGTRRRHRLVERLQNLSAVGYVGVILGSSAVVAFVVTYLAKAALGIDIMRGAHLSDLLSALVP